MWRRSINQSLGLTGFKLADDACGYHLDHCRVSFLRQHLRKFRE